MVHEFCYFNSPQILFDPSWESIWAEFGVDDVIRDVGPLSLRRPWTVTKAHKAQTKSFGAVKQSNACI